MRERSSNTPVHQESQNPSNSTGWTGACVLSAVAYTGIALCSQCWHCLRKAPPKTSSERKKFINLSRAPDNMVYGQSWWGKISFQYPRVFSLHLLKTYSWAAEP